MSDVTLNRFLASGTTAERTAFTPSPPTPASGPDPGYLWWDTDTQTEWSYDFGMADWVELAGGGGSGTVTNTGTLTANQLIKGNGGVDITVGDLSGDVTTSGTMATTIANNAVTTGKILNANVTLAKIANAAANDKLLGSGNSGSGAPYAEITLGTGLSMSGTTLNGTASGTVLPVIAGGRLTTESGVPISTSDRSAQATIYYTPYLGSTIALYNGATWAYSTFTERSLALSGLTSGKNYDVFLYDNTGTLTLELSAAWSNDTTRTDAITLQDGIYVKSGATTRRLVGTIRTTSTTTTADVGGGVSSQVGGQRFVWNYQNQVFRKIGVIDTTNLWSYTTASWRQANNASGNKVEWIQGLVGQMIDLRLMQLVNVASNVANGGRSGIGYDTTSGATGIYGNVYSNSTLLKANSLAYYVEPAALGYHFGAWMEYGGTGTMDWIGDDAGPDAQSGITGGIWC